ncbi:hypothetical protein E5H25_18100 [Acinetobacter baumannii]|uniref:hypothetical protein n=1 Tax=Acinetobacter baumannii TaxID=470 RepID=UPI0010A512A0|nr:hypothetical protein [Acinetobacter baumannii]MDH2493350.1 hypothetical protein [Acinetobacter baumannii]MDO7242826.1 hypothetical protein [Acinetobacter baumannii]MDW2795283.1 hypothetical protein [Acinetobacter baumannii]MDW5349530.1 hypothetical protein [Acinetobacter baumannii]MDW5367044.1 hypothetical protein [Acinetobacter baumannii]
MNKKELTEKVTGWILALTVYTVAVFYLLNKVLGITGDDLDALISLLGVGATLFGGYMAIYLFTDWREQTNKQMLANEAKELWKKFVTIEKESFNIDLIYSDIDDNTILKDTENYLQAIGELHKKIDDVLVDFHFFKELCKDKSDISILYSELYGANKDYKTMTEKYENETVGEYYNIDYSYRETIEIANENIRNYLSSYIHV